MLRGLAAVARSDGVPLILSRTQPRMVKLLAASFSSESSVGDMGVVLICSIAAVAGEVGYRI